MKLWEGRLIIRRWKVVIIPLSPAAHGHTAILSAQRETQVKSGPNTIKENGPTRGVGVAYVHLFIYLFLLLFLVWFFPPFICFSQDWKQFLLHFVLMSLASNFLSVLVIFLLFLFISPWRFTLLILSATLTSNTSDMCEVSLALACSGDWLKGHSLLIFSQAPLILFVPSFCSHSPESVSPRCSEALGRRRASLSGSAGQQAVNNFLQLTLFSSHSFSSGAGGRSLASFLDPTSARLFNNKKKRRRSFYLKSLKWVRICGDVNEQFGLFSAFYCLRSELQSIQFYFFFYFFALLDIVPIHEICM